MNDILFKITWWNVRPCLDKFIWWMSEYSLTNNAFQPELNRNNLVKFVDLHAKWVGIIDHQENFLWKMQHLCQDCPQCIFECVTDDPWYSVVTTIKAMLDKEKIHNSSMYSIANHCHLLSFEWWSSRWALYLPPPLPLHL